MVVFVDRVAAPVANLPILAADADILYRFEGVDAAASLQQLDFGLGGLTEKIVRGYMVLLSGGSIGMSLRWLQYVVFEISRGFQRLMI